MTLPEGVRPSGSTTDPTKPDFATAAAFSESTVKTPVAENPVVTEPVTTEDATTAEDASDAELRAWAKDNGFESVPASGKLSAFWREQITDAMAATLDPKDEASAKATSSGSFTSLESPETVTTVTLTPDGEETSSPTEEPAEELAEEPVEEVEPMVEYHSVFQPPNTFVSSQAFTA